MLPRDPRFWRGYALAWLPMLTAYLGFIVAGNGLARLHWSVALALENTLPAALAGVLPVAAARRWPLIDDRGGGGPWGPAVFRRVAVHIGAAGLYTAAWYAGLLALQSLEWSIVRGAPTLAHFSFRETRWQLGTGLVVYCAVAALGMAREQGVRLRAVAARVAEEEALRQRAELAALRAQLNPHFVFNALHSLLELVRAGDPEAEEAIERFAALARYAFDPRADAHAEVPLERELDAVADYLAIEALRLGERLTVRVTADASARRCLLPALILQPLVENAVRHAAAPRVERTRVSVDAGIDGGRLTLAVRDDGPGADPAAVLAAPGTGVRSVTRRLALRFGDAAAVRLDTRPGAGFAVTVSLPARTADMAPALKLAPARAAPGRAYHSAPHLGAGDATPA